MISVSFGSKQGNHLMGHVTINECEYPFVFFNQFLNVLPPTKKDQNESQKKLLEEIMHQYPKVGQKSKKHNNEWMYPSPLNAKLDSGKDAQFLIWDNPTNFNGFLQYKTTQVSIYNGREVDLNKIQRLVLESDAIDSFYPPHAAYKINFSVEEQKIKNSTVSPIYDQPRLLGEYIYEDIKVSFFIRASCSVTMYSAVPVETKSTLIIDFATPVSWKYMNRIIEHVREFLTYTTSRINISFSDIAFSSTKEKGASFGKVQLLNQPPVEEDSKLLDLSIKYCHLNQHISPLLQALANEEIPYEHFYETLGERKTYRLNRVIFLFAAFEREYRNIYAPVNLRSEEYHLVKQSVLDFINNRLVNASGKERKYLREFSRFITNHENAFADKFTYTIKEIHDSIKPFWMNEYSEMEDKQIDDVAVRLNIFRNDLMHGNINYDWQPIHFSDLLMLELSIYIMRLAKIGVSEKNIQSAINELYGYNFRMEPDLIQQE